MNITATMVKELRERTGAGMMDAKKALVGLTCALIIGGVCYLTYTYAFHFILLVESLFHF